MMPDVMQGAILRSDSTVELRTFERPIPKHGEVLIKTKSSALCESDVRCISPEDLGEGAESAHEKICGHEIAGQIVQCGPGMRRFKRGDRVMVYHVSGCGLCLECRKGYMISCQNKRRRQAYGRERDGGMAEYVLAEEKDLTPLPDELTYTDGALIACGFCSAYEGVDRIGVSGKDVVLVNGLGPVGLASLMLARAMGAHQLIGIDPNPARRQLAKELHLADVVICSGPYAADRVLDETHGFGCEKVIECSGNDRGRLTAIQATRQWGDCVFIGEGMHCMFAPSRDLIHEQKKIHGSWGASIWKMEELAGRMARWNIHPETIVTHRFPLEKIEEAYILMASGKCGKVIVAFDEAAQEHSMASESAKIREICFAK